MTKEEGTKNREQGMKDEVEEMKNKEEETRTKEERKGKKVERNCSSKEGRIWCYCNLCSKTWIIKYLLVI